jgi:HTH-type transcriptional regulator, sugar sensing transcriptional regulator
LEAERLLRERFGLNAYEVKLYVSLLAGPLNAKAAADASGVPLPRTYDTLKSLERKGFATATARGYVASEPVSALKAVQVGLSEEFQAAHEERARAAAQIAKALAPKFNSRSRGQDDPVMLKGLGAISSAFLDVVGRSSDVLLLVRRGVEAKWRFLGLLAGAGRKGIRVRALVPPGVPLRRSDLVAASSAGLEVRKAGGILLDMMVGDESDVIIGVPAGGEEGSFGAVAIWIRDPSFASSLRRTVEPMWRRARPVGR